MSNRTIQICARLLICAFVQSGVAAALPQYDQPDFTLADISALVKLSAPVLSPDGKRAALVVTRSSLDENTVAHTLVLIDTKTGAQSELASGEFSDLSWSSDGRRLAWLAPGDDKTLQIHVTSVNALNGSPSVITSAAGGAGVRAFAWSPDGESFAYLAQDAPTLVGDARFDRTWEISDDDYLGTTFLATKPMLGPARLWLISSTTSGAARNLTPNSTYIQDLAWLPDGKSVLINTQPGASAVASRQGSLRSVDVERGTETVILPAPARVGPYSRMKVSSQGLLAYRHFSGSDPWNHVNNIAVVLKGQPVDVTAAIDRDIDDLAWMADGRTLLVKAADHARFVLWTQGTAGAAKRLDLGAVNPVSAVSTSTGPIAFIGSEPTLPPELYVMKSTTAKPVRLTKFNDAVASRRLGKVEILSWKNESYDHDGTITYPPDFQPSRQYPMLVDIHGGPEGSAIHSFNESSQFYAAKGWLVFEPNYRGSSDQGNRYQQAIIGDITAGSGRDIMAGIAAVKARGIVDAKRIAVSGWSWGGVMSTWLITQHQDWCAAIPGALVVDFADYYDQSETGFWMQTILGSPYTPGNRQKYLEQSTVSYLDRITTPTLVWHNAGDPNAPVTQAYTLYHALKDRGVKAKLVVRGIEGHVLGDPFQEKNYYVRQLAWMEENCPLPKP